MKAPRYLGLMYQSGDGVPKDAQKAAAAFRLAAQRGDITGQYLLGQAYETGQGVPQNPQTALYWYQQAAKRGDAISAPAMLAIAHLYEQGIGVAQDVAAAKRWREQAAQAQTINLHPQTPHKETP